MAGGTEETGGTEKTGRIDEAGYTVGSRDKLDKAEGRDRKKVGGRGKRKRWTEKTEGTEKVWQVD